MQAGEDDEQMLAAMCDRALRATAVTEAEKDREQEEWTVQTRKHRTPSTHDIPRRDSTAPLAPRL